MKYVNETGLAEIASFLAANHKKESFTTNQVYAWAQEAEESMGNGNPPMIEIRSFDSKSGRPEALTISEAGISENEV